MATAAARRLSNVARCWTYETSVLLNESISNNIPYNDFFEYYAPDFKLHLTPSMAMENLNEREELERTTQEVLENLSALKGAPSLTLQDVPPDWATRDAGAAERNRRWLIGRRAATLRGRGRLWKHP